MPGLSSLVIAESDPLTREAVKYAFEREGISVSLADSAAAVSTALQSATQQLVIVGATASASAGVDVLEELRASWKQGNGAVPLLYLGEEPTHAKAMAAGATQCLPRPTFARDIVTVARLLANRKRQGGPATFVGDLGDFYGLYYVVRALAAVRWRGVLTLVRGLRRGELRLYDGEVTSAQVGVLHGLSALHQLALWTDARLELRVEDVVRRRQIPLSPAETLTDIERFLAAIREESGALSPAAVFEQDTSKTEGLPKEVLPVLRLFDGARTVADVIEDSPYRVFETLRVSARLAELGIINRVRGAASKSAARAALAIEEWLVGSSPVPEPTARAQSEPVGPEPGEPASPPGHQRKRRKKKKKRRKTRESAATSPPDNGSRATDWSALLPSAMHSDLPGYAAVVPSVSTGGEISSGRERLEEVTNEAERAAMFGDGVVSEIAPAVQAETPLPTPSKKNTDDVETSPTLKLPRSSVQVEVPAAESAPTASETRQALAALPSPTERLAEEADEAVHAAHDAASAAMLAIKAAREPIAEEPASIKPAEEEVVDEGWDNKDTEVVEKVELDAITARPPATVLEPEPEPERERERTPIKSGELQAQAAPTRVGEVDSGGISVEPSLLGQPPAPEPQPQAAPPQPQAAPPQPRIPQHPRAATPSPSLEAEAAATAAHAVRAAQAVAAFSAEEEAFFRAGHKIQEQPTTPVETFEDLETEPPKTFWQRLVSRPDQVKRAESQPVIDPKKKR